MLTRSPLISTQELDSRLSDRSVKLIDGSWHLDGRDAQAEFAALRIPGSVFFDLDAVSDSENLLPHMLPSPGTFARAMGELGISERDPVVVYDTAGLFSAPRVWWTLRMMGAEDVRVLDGGLPKWLSEGRTVDRLAPLKPTRTIFNPSFDRSMVAYIDNVWAALDGSAQLADARPAARFLGEAPEPRVGLRSGHMPGAKNVPFKTLMAGDGTLLRGSALEDTLIQSGIDLDQPVITTCGSGVTAAVISLALCELGRSSALYDGAWAEWGGRDDTPVLPAASSRP